VLDVRQGDRPPPVPGVRDRAAVPHLTVTGTGSWLSRRARHCMTPSAAREHGHHYSSSAVPATRTLPSTQPRTWLSPPASCWPSCGVGVRGEPVELPVRDRSSDIRGVPGGRRLPGAPTLGDLLIHSAQRGRASSPA
jgi:hypothetical protein